MLITRSGSSAASRETQRLPGRRAGRQVQVGDVQHPERLAPRPAAPAPSTRRSRKAFTSYSPAYASAARRPSAPAPPGPVGREAGRRRPEDRRHEEKATSAGCLPDWIACPASTTPLKERLRADLTTAIKARDKVRVRHDPDGAVGDQRGRGGRRRAQSSCPTSRCWTSSSGRRRSAARRRRRTPPPAATELAEKERAESAVLADYLPQPARRGGDQRDRRRARSPDRRG